MNEAYAAFPLAGLVVCLSLAGCLAPRPPGAALLFDAAGGTTWTNHVKLVPDPAGGEQKVLLGERVAKDSCQMTFINDKGFFAVPDGLRGAVIMRLLVRGEGQVRVALVSGQKMKSYYRRPLATNQWCEITLPLAELKGKVDAGDRINDITVWLQALQKGAPLAADARIYLDRVVFDPAATAGPAAPEAAGSSPKR
jgi:hypothetical protein